MSANERLGQTDGDDTQDLELTSRGAPRHKVCEVVRRQFRAVAVVVFAGIVRELPPSSSGRFELELFKG